MGGWRGGFFFRGVFGAKSGQSMSIWTMDFPCKFYLGAGGKIYFPFSQWEGPRCFAFIPFKFGGVGRIFFSFSFVSQCVPSKFLMGSQYVPQHVLHISTSLLTHMLWQMLLSFHLCRRAKGEDPYTSKQNLLF